MCMGHGLFGGYEKKGLKIMTNKNRFIRNIYSPGYSFITLSYYGNGLSIGFTPHIGYEECGKSIYAREKFQSVTIDYQQAAILYLLMKPVAEGVTVWEFRHKISCNKQAELIFEYTMNPDGDKRAYLTLNKNGDEISFEFPVGKNFVMENGDEIIIEVQYWLELFVRILDNYLASIGAEEYLNQLTAEQQDDCSMEGDVCKKG